MCQNVYKIWSKVIRKKMKSYSQKCFWQSQIIKNYLDYLTHTLINLFNSFLLNTENWKIAINL